MMLPGFRTSVAIAEGVENNILFTTWGGLGDQICAEPTLRFALDTFKAPMKVSLASENPEFFRHLHSRFHEVIDIKQDKFDPAKYLVLETMTTPDSLAWQFVSHMVVNCVDCPSLNALRCMIPIRYKQIQLDPPEPTDTELLRIIGERDRHVIVHAGLHWESKTYPKDWWSAVVDEMIRQDLVPVLIGKDVGPGCGVVDIDPPAGSIDLRNRCTLNETTWLCRHALLVACSDSSPLHMAAAGNAHIAFVATAKHPDYISHWRAGGWSWRMKNFSRGGLWDVLDYCPNKAQNVNVDKCAEEMIRGWLPDPKEIAAWLVSSRSS